MKYERLVPVLVNAIKELSAKNDALEARIKKLEDG
jgi:cell division protein FtsB